MFPFSTCAREWRRAADIEAALEETVAIESVRVAAFDAPTGYLRAEGDYVAVFAGLDPRLDGAATHGVAVGARDGQIFEIRLACGTGAAQASMIHAGQTEFLLPPPT